MSQKGPAPLSFEAVQKLKRDVARLERELRAAKQDADRDGQKSRKAAVEAKQTADDELERAKDVSGGPGFVGEEEDRRRVERLSQLLDLIKEIGEEQRLEVLFDRIAAGLASQTGYRRVLIRLREPGPFNADVFRSRGFAGYDAKARAQLETHDLALDTFEPWLGEEFQIGGARFIPHGSAPDAVIVKGEIQDLGERERGEWHAEDALLLPLYGRTGALVACISLDDPESRLKPSLETVELLELLGLFALARIENAGLHVLTEAQAVEVVQTRRREHRAHGMLTGVLTRMEQELAAALEFLHGESRGPAPGSAPGASAPAGAAGDATGIVAKLEEALQWLGMVKRAELPAAAPGPGAQGTGGRKPSRGTSGSNPAAPGSIAARGASGRTGSAQAPPRGGR